MSCKKIFYHVDKSLDFRKNNFEFSFFKYYDAILELRQTLLKSL